MYPSPNYPTDMAEAEAFVARQRHGTLIATAPDGYPQTSILPFLKDGDTIELHGVQEDPTFQAMRASGRATFLVSDFLAFTPHDWVDPRDGGKATLHFKAVALECDAEVSIEPADVAGALARLLATYEPGKSYERMEDGQFYGGRLRRLAVARLRVRQTRAKFKVGPAAPVAVKLGVAEHLRERDEPGDARAADLIEQTVRTASGA